MELLLTQSARATLHLITRVCVCMCVCIFFHWVSKWVKPTSRGGHTTTTSMPDVSLHSDDTTFERLSASSVQLIQQLSPSPPPSFITSFSPESHFWAHVQPCLTVQKKKQTTLSRRQTHQCFPNPARKGVQQRVSGHSDERSHWSSGQSKQALI